MLNLLTLLHLLVLPGRLLPLELGPTLRLLDGLAVGELRLGRGLGCLALDLKSFWHRLMNPHLIHSLIGNIADPQ